MRRTYNLPIIQYVKTDVTIGVNALRNSAGRGTSVSEIAVQERKGKKSERGFSRIKAMPMKR